MPEAIAASAAPAMPAPAGTPVAPTVTSTSNPAMAQAFAKLDGMDHAGDGPQPEPKKEAPAKAPAKDAAKPADANTPPEVKPADAKPADAKPTDTTDKPGEPKPGDATPAPAKRTAWQYAREMERQRSELQKERDILKQEIDTLKKGPATPADDPEKQALTKRLSELEDHMRFVDYTKSKEYVEQFQKPYEDTAKSAEAHALSLKVTGEDGTKRNLTAQEFWSIVRMPDPDDAVEAAEALFGQGSLKAGQVIERRNDIIKAYTAMKGAESKYRAEGAERTKQQQAALAAQQKQAQEQWTQRATKFRDLNKAGESHDGMKDVFVAAPEDAEGAKLLQEYRHEADRAFANGAPLAEGEQQWNDDEILVKHSVIRNRAGAFPYVVRQYRNAVAKIKELEAAIAGYKKSEPTDGSVRGGEEQQPQGNVFQQALSKLDQLQ